MKYLSYYYLGISLRILLDNQKKLFN